MARALLRSFRSILSQMIKKPELTRYKQFHGGAIEPGAVRAKMVVLSMIAFE